jgi:O-antigen/teichoic acid export membrane protein
MSTAVSSIDSAAPLVSADADAPAPVRRPSRLGFLQRNSWALADQVLISGTNFATGILTARALSQAEFGAFSVINAGLLFANIFQSTLIVQAHNVLGATRCGDEYRRYTASTTVQHMWLLAVELLIVLPLIAFAWLRGWPSTAMLVALVPSIVFWQLQQYVRRVMYTEQRYAAAFWNDLVSYGGQAVVLVALFAAFKAGRAPFTGAIAFHVLAWTSAVAALIGFWQVRGSHAHVSREQVRTYLTENWRFGKWLAGGEILQWCSSLHMQVWWAALLLGAAASADLRAAMILFGPARVISFFLITVLPTRFAKALHTGGPDALHARLKTVYLGLIPTVGVYCLLLAIFPRPILRLMYGEQYVNAAATTILMLYALASFLNYMQMVTAAALTASRQTRYIFTASLSGCGVALALSPILIKQFGAPGGILSMIATTLVVSVIYTSAYARRVRHAAVAVDVKEPA